MKATSTPNPITSLYVQAMHELAASIGLDPADIVKTASVEAEGVRFYFRDTTEGDDKALSVLAEIGEIPASATPEVLRQLLEANAHLSVRTGTYALVPGTNFAALRVHVQLDEGASNGERVLGVLRDHLASCKAVRHLGTALQVEPGASVANADLA